MVFHYILPTCFGPCRPSSKISHIWNIEKCRLRFFWDMSSRFISSNLKDHCAFISRDKQCNKNYMPGEEQMTEGLNLQQHWCEHLNFCNHLGDGTFGIEGTWGQDTQSTKRVDTREVFTQQLQWEDKQRQKHAARWHGRSYLPFSSTHILKSILLPHLKRIGLRKNAFSQKKGHVVGVLTLLLRNSTAVWFLNHC